MSPTRVRHAALTAAPLISLNQAQLSQGTDRFALVIAPQWVGDAILSLPLIDQLHREYDAVDVLAMPAVAAVYQCSTSVRTVNVQPFAHGELQWRLRRSVAKSIKGRFSAAIVLPNSLKSALIPWLAGISIRRGALGEHRYVLLNERRQAVSQQDSMLIQYLSLADEPIAREKIDAMNIHRPRLSVPEDEKKKVLSQLHAGDQLMVICPGAEYGPAKQWPKEYFAAVAKAWIAKSGQHRLAILGSAKESQTGEKIAQMVGADTTRVLNLCGKTSLLEAFAWISAAKVVVSNDSGLMHAAAAQDIAVIAVFGSTDPIHTPPHSPKARVVRLGLDCSPCFQKVCPLGTTACLKDLPAQMVLDQIKAFGF